MQGAIKWQMQEVDRRLTGKDHWTWHQESCQWPRTAISAQQNRTPRNKVGKRKWKHNSPWEKFKKPRQFTIRSNYLRHCYFLYPLELTQWQRRESPFLPVDDVFHEVTCALTWYVQWFREGASLLLIKIVVHPKAGKYTKWQLLKCPINCMDICSKLLL